MLLINRDDAIQWRYGFFSDLLLWCIGVRKVKIFWHDPIVQHVHIYALKKTVHRIESHIVHKWKWIYLLSTAVQYLPVCVSNEVADGIAYCTIICHDSILFHIWMCSFIVQHREQSIPSISNSNYKCDEVVWYFPRVPCVQAHSLNIL